MTDTDKLTDSGYKSTDAGFSIGTGFEQYDDLYLSSDLGQYVNGETLLVDGGMIASQKFHD